MMDSLRSATQNTMFEQWLDATMKPALEPKQDRLHQQQVLHLLRHMHVLQDSVAAAAAAIAAAFASSHACLARLCCCCCCVAAAVQSYAVAYACVKTTL